MPIEIPKDKWPGSIKAITIGATAAEGGTRTRTVTVGGQTTMPYLQYEAPTPNKPVIAIEIKSRKPEDWSPLLANVWGEALADPAQWAKKAEEAEADLVVLALTVEDLVEDAVRVVKSVLGATGLPLIVWGPGQAEKDNELLVPVSEATKGEKLVLGICEDKNYRTIVATAMANGHLVQARAPMDVNLSKQLNILISDMGMPKDRILMDPTTGALGYGIEYGYSVMERLRLAALQGDVMTQFPMLVTPGFEAWKTKESKVGEGVPEAWGDWKARSIHWETLTAMSLVESGADIVVLRHPESVRRIKQAIEELMVAAKEINMALSGIQIYKMLPQTNCKECGFPTCLAFAMKLAAKQVELGSCPYVSEESKKHLAESAAPPIRLITLKANGTELKVGNEVVMFRHEKTFYNKPGLFLRVKASDPDIARKVATADAYKVNYVGMDFSLDGFAIEADGDLVAAVKAVRGVTKHPLMLIGNDAALLDLSLSLLAGEGTLVYAADSSNYEALADVAKKHKASLVVKADSLDALADLTQKVQARGVEDMVLDLGGKNLGEWLTRSTQARRLALKSNFKPLGYPTIFFAAQNGMDKEAVYAAQAIAKYAGFVVLDTFAPEMIYPLLVLRENIYTDPQKPIQVQPGIYEINSPKPESPVLVTTNFSITYFAVANEVEGSGLPAWLVVTDAEGMSVLTAWAAGKFDAERIAKAIKSFDVASKVSRKRIVLPGHVAVLSGELEEELAGWEIRVGPREAVDLPAFMKQALN